MALLQKQQVRNAVAQAIDDAQFSRWTMASLDVLISLVQDTMWEAILNTFEFLLSQADTVSPSSGVIALGSLTKRLFRIQQVSVSGIVLQPKLFTENFPQGTYYLLGSNLVTDPSVASASTVVTYSYMPTKFADLAADSTVLDSWPDGHEAALIYTAAAWAMTKGDAESMQQIARLADMAIEAMLSHIVRRYPIGTYDRVAQVKQAIMRNLVEAPQQ